MLGRIAQPVRALIQKRPVGQEYFVFISVFLIRIQQLFQIINYRPHQRRDFFLFIAGQKADVVVELCVGAADDDTAVFPGWKL